MNVPNCKTLLSQQIVTYTGQTPDDAQLNQFIAGATLAYSRFRNLERRYGEGALSVDAPTNSSSIKAVGGPFVSGATITIDAYTQWAETVTISTVDRIAPSANTDLTGDPVTLNLTTPTTQPHYAGISIIVNASMGLQLVVGQSQYVMPGDFIRANARSFGKAVGIPIPSTQMLYGRIYVQSQSLQPTGWGISQTFQGSGVGLPGAFLGIPAGIGNNNFNAPDGCLPFFEWIGTSPVIFNVWPAPTVAKTLFFTYRAIQQPETIPDSDMDAIVAYARYLALTSNADIIANAPDFRDIRQDQKFSSAAANLRELAQKALDEFNSKVAHRPVMVTG